MVRQKQSKIQTLQNLSKICHTLKRKGKTIGLITGCFDVIHIGHVELFKFAKRNCDILIVGLDNDKSIRLSKGLQRPIFPWKYRAKLLQELFLVDFIFKITKVINFESSIADKVCFDILKKVTPHKIFTNSCTDKFYANKKKRAAQLGIHYVDTKQRRFGSSTRIIEKLEL